MRHHSSRNFIDQQTQTENDPFTARSNPFHHDPFERKINRQKTRRTFNSDGAVGTGVEGRIPWSRLKGVASRKFGERTSNVLVNLSDGPACVYLGRLLHGEEGASGGISSHLLCVVGSIAVID